MTTMDSRKKLEETLAHAGMTMPHNPDDCHICGRDHTDPKDREIAALKRHVADLKKHLHDCAMVAAPFTDCAVPGCNCKAVAIRVLAICGEAS